MIEIDTVENIDKVCCGTHGSSAIWLRYDGKMYGTGQNSSEQLMSAEKTTADHTAIYIPKLLEFSLKCLEASSNVSCCILVCENGSVWSSGDALYGEHGHEPETSVKAFTKVDGFKDTKIKSVSMGSYHSLFLDEAGKVWSCGSNHYGQCGDDMNALDDKGGIWCFGDGKYGQCGIDIKAGSYHSGCTTKDRKFWLWRSNEFNESLKMDNNGTDIFKPNCINQCIIDIEMEAETTIILVNQ